MPKGYIIVRMTVTDPDTYKDYAAMASEAMRQLIDAVTPQYDYVIIDSPPILSVADANLTSPLVDGAVLVVDAGRTRQSQLVHAVTSFETAGGRIAGAVLNKARQRRNADGYYVEASRPTPAHLAKPSRRAARVRV